MTRLEVYGSTVASQAINVASVATAPALLHVRTVASRTINVACVATLPALLHVRTRCYIHAVSTASIYP